MKKFKLKIYYFIWRYFASKNKFPKLCENINLRINRLENGK